MKKSATWGYSDLPQSLEKSFFKHSNALFQFTATKMGSFDLRKKHDLHGQNFNLMVGVLERSLVLTI
jgi:hypothetical protein